MPLPCFVGQPLPGSSSLVSRSLLRLLPLALLLPWATASTLNCHKTCICASNIVSCSKMNLTSIPAPLPIYTAVLDVSYNGIARLSAEWTTVELTKLHNLLLSHNGMHFISTEAFLYVTHVRYLDLSSNRLRQLDESMFEPLEHLEVLLLYKNRISQIDRLAFTGLAKLQKLYLSQNQVSRFPLELVREKTRLERLSLLDVSSNRVKVLPIPELKALPAWIKNGLYFHDNPFACNCELYNMLAHWHIRQLTSAVDFKDDYTCILPGPKKTTVAVFDLNRDYLNCSTVKAEDQETYLEETLILNCDTRHRVMNKTWMIPGNVLLTPGGNRSARVLADVNGRLEIASVQLEDSGIYTCFAVSEAFNETLYVTVKVHNFTLDGSSETLNTAYTTLIGCLASVILVLIYLYLTPCRCPCHSKAKGQQEDSIHSSMLSAAPSHEDLGTKAGLSRHVAFLDPRDLRGQNGKVKPDAGEDLENRERDGRRDRGLRKKSDAESISSVCSDTPIVV
ncbi:amphoterin-induced protein 1-like [Anguilla rostrata]|uniref:amphoterin-induced protein 1-like n=1 Tax=Anguilla anguilla TaxID=7936 RepID=UPI0015AE20EE|nr:amphoterin-induced protein 1-like [Anguilla anguilla]